MNSLTSKEEHTERTQKLAAVKDYLLLETYARPKQWEVINCYSKRYFRVSDLHLHTDMHVQFIHMYTHIHTHIYCTHTHREHTLTPLKTIVY